MLLISPFLYRVEESALIVGNNGRRFQFTDLHSRKTSAEG
jgi:hypothetical protein